MEELLTCGRAGHPGDGEKGPPLSLAMGGGGTSQALLSRPFMSFAPPGRSGARDRVRHRDFSRDGHPAERAGNHECQDR